VGVALAVVAEIVHIRTGGALTRALSTLTAPTTLRMSAPTSSAAKQPTGAAASVA
jgi:hypothetical protein